jgi:hypothetical protein
MLAKILAIVIISNYKSYNYLLYFWTQILVGHPMDIPKHVVNPKIHVKAWIF